MKTNIGEIIKYLNMKIKYTFANISRSTLSFITKFGQMVDTFKKNVSPFLKTIWKLNEFITWFSTYIFKLLWLKSGKNLYSQKIISIQPNTSHYQKINKGLKLITIPPFLHNFCIEINIYTHLPSFNTGLFLFAKICNKICCSFMLRQLMMSWNFGFFLINFSNKKANRERKNNKSFNISITKRAFEVK